MSLNELPPLMKMSDIVSTKRHKGLVPFGRTKFHEYRKAGKIPQGRQFGSANSPVYYTDEEIKAVIQMMKDGELAQ